MRDRSIRISVCRCDKNKDLCDLGAGFVLIHQHPLIHDRLCLIQIRICIHLDQQILTDLLEQRRIIPLPVRPLFCFRVSILAFSFVLVQPQSLRRRDLLTQFCPNVILNMQLLEPGKSGLHSHSRVHELIQRTPSPPHQYLFPVIAVMSFIQDVRNRIEQHPVIIIVIFRLAGHDRLDQVDHSGRRLERSGKFLTIHFLESALSVGVRRELNRRTIPLISPAVQRQLGNQISLIIEVIDILKTDAGSLADCRARKGIPEYATLVDIRSFREFSSQEISDCSTAAVPGDEDFPVACIRTIRVEKVFLQNVDDLVIRKLKPFMRTARAQIEVTVPLGVIGSAHRDDIENISLPILIQNLLRNRKRHPVIVLIRGCDPVVVLVDFIIGHIRQHCLDVCLGICRSGKRHARLGQVSVSFFATGGGILHQHAVAVNKACRKRGRRPMLDIAAGDVFVRVQKIHRAPVHRAAVQDRTGRRGGILVRLQRCISRPVKIVLHVANTDPVGNVCAHVAPLTVFCSSGLKDGINQPVVHAHFFGHRRNRDPVDLADRHAAGTVAADLIQDQLTVIVPSVGAVHGKAFPAVGLIEACSVCLTSDRIADDLIGLKHSGITADRKTMDRICDILIENSNEQHPIVPGEERDFVPAVHAVIERHGKRISPVRIRAGLCLADRRQQTIFTDHTDVPVCALGDVDVAAPVISHAADMVNARLTAIHAVTVQLAGWTAVLLHQRDRRHIAPAGFIENIKRRCVFVLGTVGSQKYVVINNCNSLRDHITACGFLKPRSVFGTADMRILESGNCKRAGPCHDIPKRRILGPGLRPFLRISFTGSRAVRRCRLSPGKCRSHQEQKQHRKDHDPCRASHSFIFTGYLHVCSKIVNKKSKRHLIPCLPFSIIPYG